MSEQTPEHDDQAGTERNEEQQEIADVQDELDARSDEDGLGAEAGSGEETGLSQG
ncbi:hypothetical protein [Nocardioides abyssi]|uniref:Uncharacterized protein n=1 Tax=Nocardioides abyssi TaxID=3058370 RepID=A0ABT8EPG8_9ACTN|nr:hypothetical protein [Nocardioides abyssi]MDN4160047.1 hypothetical protein [Nocardioides abyssi]